MRAAIHLELNASGLGAFHILVGGTPRKAKCPVKNFLNQEDRDNGTDTTEVTCTIDPQAIGFPANRTVTDWKPITQELRDLAVAEGVTIRWDEKQVLVRYRFRAN